MICDECGARSATIKLMTIVGEERRERHLCTECMAKVKNQFTAVDLSSLAGLLGGLLQAVKPSDNGEGAQEQGLSCPSCGLRYDEFKKSSFLGCPECYQAFREPLEVMIKRIHGHAQHTGRMPGGTPDDFTLRLEIDQLKHQLNRAIAEEAYEQAADLRDRIRALKEQLDKTEPQKEEAHHD